CHLLACVRLCARVRGRHPNPHPYSPLPPWIFGVSGGRKTQGRGLGRSLALPKAPRPRKTAPRARARSPHPTVSPLPPPLEASGPSSPKGRPARLGPGGGGSGRRDGRWFLGLGIQASRCYAGRFVRVLRYRGRSRAQTVGGRPLDQAEA